MESEKKISFENYTKIKKKQPPYFDRESSII